MTVAPVCVRCRARHRVDLPCWRGRYRARVSATFYALHPSRACWLGYDGCTGTATTVDHDVPRSRGGTDADENLRPACAHCNYSRGARDPFSVSDLSPPRGPALSSRWTKPRG